MTTPTPTTGGGGQGDGPVPVWERWYAHPDGRVLHRCLQAAAGIDPAGVRMSIPAGCREISAEEAQALLERARRETEQAASAAAAQAAAEAEEGYRTLTGIGIPAALAARLTGHRP
ncbi:hypothetical protein [Thermomonospora cellulosilytica]|uniref:Uncharacterized protein n=1 Tax=Thermomonospora cellulosilytica TaxID=1411118 RepID=A0A7W3N1P4_9ACTN|nr:hypothetical protein [Thermomonospora cellulosilytica]MBA9005906.1 hypothetical protein [Thermomonospora cellulosilytica]